ncbi:hypothetical protein K8I61_18465 [bacterium]|nr:hypothetical protein [bacterium]
MTPPFFFEPGFSRRSVLTLFVVLTTIYYASAFPIAASNEGAHYALARAIVEEGTFKIDTWFVDFTGGVDFAIKDGHYYSDRAPGVAFLLVPFHAVAVLVAKFGGWLPDHTGKHFATVFVSWAGALVVILLLRLLLRQGRTPAVAWIVALVFALASMHWKFSAHLYNHAFEALFFLALWSLLGDGLDFTKSTARERAFFASLAYIACIAFPAGMFWVLLPLANMMLPNGRTLPIVRTDGVGAGLVSRYRVSRDAAEWRGLATNIGFAALALVPVAIYHTVCFGAPWRTFGRWHNPERFAFFHEPGMMFDTPWHVGMNRLLFGLPDPYPIGLFWLHPILIFAFLGAYFYARERPAAAAMQFVAIFAWSSLFAKFHEFDGGSSGDPRYLMLTLPILFLPFGAWLDSVNARVSDVGMRALAHLPVALLVAVGFWFCFVHLAEYFGHDFNVREHLDHFSLISRDGVAELFGRAFPSWRKTPIYLGTLAPIAAAWAMIRLLRAQRG